MNFDAVFWWAQITRQQRSTNAKVVYQLEQSIEKSNNYES